MAVSQLPPELIHLVLLCLEKYDLKTVRRTCKAFNDACIPLLFDTIYIAPNYAEMEIAAKVFSRFKGSITTLFYGSYYLEMLSFHAFFEQQETDNSNPFRHEEQARKNNLRGLWEIHWRLSNEYHQLMESGSFLAQLSQILKALPLLRRVILTGDPRPRGDCLCRQAVMDAGKRQQNPIPNASTILASVDPHADPYCVGLTSRLRWGRKPDNPWRTLLEVLIEAEISVKEISVGVRLDGGMWRLPNSPDIFAFRMTNDTLQKANPLLAGLTHLILHLQPSYRGGDRVEAAPNASSLLSATPNLRLLELRYCDWMEMQRQWDQGSAIGVHVNSFGALIGANILPLLESLELSVIDGTQHDFLQFLRGSPLLKHLSLDFVCLYSGTWGHTIEEMKRFLHLESINFERYRDEKGEWAFFDLEDFIKWKDLFSGFFLENGPNPFSKEAKLLRRRS